MLAAIPIILGFVFLISGFIKLFDASVTVATFVSLNFSENTAEILTFCLLFYEISIGVYLVFLKERNIVPKICLVTLCLFSAYLIYLLTLQKPPSCGCFGALKLFRSNKQEAVFGLVRNLALILLLLYWMLKQRQRSPKY